MYGMVRYGVTVRHTDGTLRLCHYLPMGSSAAGMLPPVPHTTPQLSQIWNRKDRVCATAPTHTFETAAA